MTMANTPWLGTSEDQILYMTPPAETRKRVMLHMKSNKMGEVTAVISLYANWFCVVHKAMRIKWEHIVQ
jgi:hypothetical protein